MKAVQHVLYEQEGNILTGKLIDEILFKLNIHLQERDSDFYAIMEASRHILGQEED